MNKKFFLPHYRGIFTNKDLCTFSLRFNILIHYIRFTTKFEHISPGLKKLLWPPIKYRIKFKVLTMVFESLHNEAPSYISDLLELKKSNYSLRSANGINLEEQRSKLKYYGDRAFSVCALWLWNMLPNSVKTSPNLDTFKKNLKTYFFKIAFS